MPWILRSSDCVCSGVASSLMKTSIMTRFLRLVAPWFKLSRVTRTAPRMAVEMNTVITAILGAVLVTRDNLNQGATSLKNRVMIEVFIKDDATPEQTQSLERKIQGMNDVKNHGYKYISKEEALARFRERFGERIISNLSINPLPASYEVQVKDADRVDSVAQQFFNDPTVDNDPGTHNGVRYARETVRKMLGTISLIEKGMWVTTGIFAAAAVLLISTTVRLSI